MTTEELIARPDPVPVMPLIRRVLRQIDREPKTWNQAVLGVRTPCGTSHCIAGHGCVMAGHELVWVRRRSLSADIAEYTTAGEHISDVAQREFGLTDCEVDSLFFAYNDREDIERVAHEIAARAGEPLWPDEAEAES